MGILQEVQVKSNIRVLPRYWYRYLSPTSKLTYAVGFFLTHFFTISQAQAKYATLSSSSSSPSYQMRANNDSSSSTLATDAGSKKKSLDDIQNNVGVLLKTLKPGDITNYPKPGETCTIHYDAYIEEDYISGENPVPFDSSRKRDGDALTSSSVQRR